jgi:hypothetical protein
MGKAGLRPLTMVFESTGLCHSSNRSKPRRVCSMRPGKSGERRWDRSGGRSALRGRYPYDSFLVNRIATVSTLFGADPYSIDGIIIAGTVLTAWGFRRYGGRGAGADQANFEQLLLDYWPGYVDRVSIPEVVRLLEGRLCRRRLLQRRSQRRQS